MNILRGFALVIVCVLLFVSLLVAGIFASLSLSLSYENVQPRVYSIADEIIQTQIGIQNITEQLTPYLNIYCKNNTEIIQNFGDYTFVFPCSVVQGGYSSILNYSVDYLVKDFYYKEYNCSFFECFKESEVPLFLVSDYARVYWKGLFYKLLLSSLVLIGLAFLLFEKRTNTPIIIGSLSVIASLIVLQLDKIGGFIAKAILSPLSLALSEESSKEILSQVIAIFFSESSTAFLWMFIIGLILIAFGIVLKFTDLGFKIFRKIESVKDKEKIDNSVTKEEVKEIVKKEIENKKNVKKK